MPIIPKIPSFRDRLALWIVVFCFVYFFYISTKRFPLELVKEIGDIKIAMITVLAGVIQYYFGSGKEDKKVNETKDEAPPK